MLVSTWWSEMDGQTQTSFFNHVDSEIAGSQPPSLPDKSLSFMVYVFVVSKPRPFHCLNIWTVYFVGSIAGCDDWKVIGYLFSNGIVYRWPPNIGYQFGTTDLGPSSSCGSTCNITQNTFHITLLFHLIEVIVDLLEESLPIIWVQVYESFQPSLTSYYDRPCHRNEDRGEVNWGWYVSQICHCVSLKPCHLDTGSMVRLRPRDTPNPKQKWQVRRTHFLLQDPT